MSGSPGAGLVFPGRRITDGYGIVFPSVPIDSVFLLTTLVRTANENFDLTTVLWHLIPCSHWIYS